MANEKRLIDANALKEKLQAHHDFFVDAWGGFSNLPQKDKARVDEITHCIAEICNAPTVDAVEVAHGRWIPQKMPTGIEAFCIKEMMVQAFMCSECGNFIDVSEGHFNYCPHCGAKMDGGADNG